MDKSVKILFAFMGTVLLALCIFIAFLLCGCGCPYISRMNYTSYSINLNEAVTTPLGAKVIKNGNEFSDEDLQKVDEHITATEECVKEWKRTQPDVMHRNYNWKAPNRSCYTVVLAPDIRMSCNDPAMEIFGKAPQESCDAKGFEYKEGCECGFRVVIQDGQYICVTPNLYLFRAGVVELLTGYPSGDLWKNKTLVICAGH